MNNDSIETLIKSNSKKISKTHIKEIIRHSELVILKKDEYLIRKDQINSPELIVLLEGSLELKSRGQFIKRLNNPGDLVDELSLISGEASPYTEIISEIQSKVMIFPYHKFKADDDDTEVSVAYLIFSNILAEKLKHLKAQALLKKKCAYKK